MAELGKQGIDATAVEGEKSQFDVIADGQLVFSKQQTGRFPEAGETGTLLASA